MNWEIENLFSNACLLNITRLGIYVHVQYTPNARLWLYHIIHRPAREEG